MKGERLLAFVGPVFGLLILAFLSGCAHSSGVDPASAPVSVFQPPSYRATHPPYGGLSIRKVEDRRPGYELGSSNVLKDSYFSDGLFDRPVPLMLKRTFATSFAQSGVFDYEADPERARYICDLRILHFYAHADRDLWGLIPFVPSIDLKARIDLRVVLTDQDGRRYLDRSFEVSDETAVSTIEGLESSSADLLLVLLSDLLDQVIGASDRGIEEFWRELGLPVDWRAEDHVDSQSSSQ